MNPGELRYKVLIQKKSSNTKTGVDGVTKQVYVDVCSMWASIKPIRKRYISDLNKIRLEVTTIIKVRYNTLIQELMRLNHEGKSYDILEVIDVDERHREMNLMCSESIALDKLCKVYKPSKALNSLNRPLGTPELAYIYPCTFIRKNVDMKQEMPNATLNAGFVLYGEPIMDIEPGDLLEIDGIKYKASLPYKPENHYTEVEIIISKDV